MEKQVGTEKGCDGFKTKTSQRASGRAVNLRNVAFCVCVGFFSGDRTSMRLPLNENLP